MIFYIYLTAAILFEVAATTALRFSDGFKYWFPTAITSVGYLCSFYFLGLSLQHIPLSVAYAIWSGVGTVLTVGVGFIVFKDNLSWLSAVGIGIVVFGVVCIQLGKSSAGGG